jgi:hypothetical protein
MATHINLTWDTKIKLHCKERFQQKHLTWTEMEHFSVCRYKSPENAIKHGITDHLAYVSDFALIKFHVTKLCWFSLAQRMQSNQTWYNWPFSLCLWLCSNKIPRNQIVLIFSQYVHCMKESTWAQYRGKLFSWIEVQICTRA